MTVGESYVGETLKRHHYLIFEARRKLKHRVPRPIPRNRVGAAICWSRRISRDTRISRRPSSIMRAVRASGCSGSRMKLPAAAYSAEVATSATKAGSCGELHLRVQSESCFG